MAKIKPIPRRIVMQFFPEVNEDTLNLIGLWSSANACLESMGLDTTYENQQRYIAGLATEYKRRMRKQILRLEYNASMIYLANLWGTNGMIDAAFEETRDDSEGVVPLLTLACAQYWWLHEKDPDILNLYREWKMVKEVYLDMMASDQSTKEKFDAMFFGDTLLNKRNRKDK